MSPEDRTALIEWGLAQVAQILDPPARPYTNLMLSIFDVQRGVLAQSPKLAEIFIIAAAQLSALPLQHPLYLELYGRLVRFGLEQLERSEWRPAR